MNRVNVTRTILGLGLASLLTLLLASCAGDGSLIPRPMNPDRVSRDVSSSQIPSSTPDRGGPQITEIPKPLPMKMKSGQPDPIVPATAAAAHEEANITLSFDQLPLPTFIQTVYGTILKRNFTVDPAVAARTDLVTLRTGRPQTPTEVAITARMLLKSYGVTVIDLGGFLKLAPDSNIQGYAPEIRRGRALPETPIPLRPVYYLVEMKAVRNTDVSNWLRTIFGNKLSTVTDDMVRNAIMLGGLSEDVISAMEAIDVLDQPMLRAHSGARFNPVFWSADDFSRKLTEVLASQGYNASTAPGGGAITILPIQPINAVLVFSLDDTLLRYTLDWAQELDKPNAKRGATTSYFIYQARYSDANDLAKTLTGVLTGATATASQLPPQIMTAAERIQADKQAAATSTSAAGTVRNSRVVVNASTNSLIFQGTGEEYVQVLNLLKDLDRPARTVLVEVTVAEVGLTKSENLGIEWALADKPNAIGSLQIGTLGGLGVGGAGLVVKQLSNAGQVRLVLDALASNNRARILSAPRIVARSGETATIQVGAQVPVITSTQTGLATGVGVLQSVQYLPTGVILKVKPIIYSGDRIDIEVSQEVSSAQNTTTGVSTSPTINTRKVETKLAMRDGATVLLGGLMSSTESIGNTGIPLLKDLPLFGQLFRVDNNSIDKTELIVLITPYVIRDDIDSQVITDAFRKQLGPWAQPPGTAAPRSLPSGSWLDLLRLPEESWYRGQESAPPKPAAGAAPPPAPPPVPTAEAKPKQ